MVDTKKEQERDELHRAIWAIADELRGAVEMAVSNYDIDEDDKKLGLELMDIYKFISDII